MKLVNEVSLRIFYVIGVASILLAVLSACVGMLLVAQATLQLRAQLTRKYAFGTLVANSARAVLSSALSEAKVPEADVPTWVLFGRRMRRIIVLFAVPFAIAGVGRVALMFLQ